MATIVRYIYLYKVFMLFSESCKNLDFFLPTNFDTEYRMFYAYFQNHAGMYSVSMETIVYRIRMVFPIVYHVIPSVH